MSLPSFCRPTKIFTCGLVCSEFKQGYEKIGPCRAIPGSARFQLVSYCAAESDNLSHKSRHHKKFQGKPSAIYKLDLLSSRSSFSRGSSFSMGLSFWVLGLRFLHNPNTFYVLNFS